MKTISCKDTINHYKLGTNILHNENGPAVIHRDYKQWWVNGFHHRDNGPAIEYTDGSYEWFVEGKRHRLDGPALANIRYSLGADNYYEYWIDGKFYSSKEDFVHAAVCYQSAHPPKTINKIAKMLGLVPTSNTSENLEKKPFKPSKRYLGYQVVRNGETKTISQLTEDEAKCELAKAIDIIEKLNDIGSKVNTVFNNWTNGNVK